MYVKIDAGDSRKAVEKVEDSKNGTHIGHLTWKFKYSYVYNVDINKKYFKTWHGNVKSSALFYIAESDTFGSTIHTRAIVAFKALEFTERTAMSVSFI